MTTGRVRVGSYTTRKGPTDTGILDCVALLTNKLPPLSGLKKAQLAEPEVD